jgi:hypothetical protein
MAAACSNVVLKVFFGGTIPSAIPLMKEADLKPAPVNENRQRA